MSTNAPSAVDWAPNKWIAALLGCFLQPLGLLYVTRLKWAIGYFLIWTITTLRSFT